MTIVSEAVCRICGENYLLRGRLCAQLIEIQDALDIREITHPEHPLEGPQRTCFNAVPLSECIFVCMYPCWYENKNTELRRYAHAPLAGEVKGFRIG